MITPIFSIIIPARNAEKFIHEALNSILQQTFQDYEVIVIDDNSSDATVEIVKNYQRKFDAEQLKILHCPKEHIPGPGAVRNVGLRAAQGEVIAFLDADDMWVCDHLEFAYHALNNYPEAVAYYGLAKSFDAETREWGRIWGYGPENTDGKPFDAFKLIIQDDPIPHPTGCVRRHIAEKAGGFEERLLTAQDWWFWICAAKYGKFVFSGRVEMLHRVSMDTHTGSGNGPNPMLSGPAFADVVYNSTILTEEGSQYLCNLAMDRTSRRLQHYVRTLQWNVLHKVCRIMQLCPQSERRIWFHVWAMVIKGLAMRAWRSVAVKAGLLPQERQFEK